MLPSSCSAAMLWRTPTVIKPTVVEDSRRRERIAECLTFYPAALVDMVEGYLSCLAYAVLPLQVNEKRTLINSEENQCIRSAIQEVLTSAQTDSRIKRQIIVNVMQYKYQREFRLLIEELQTMDIQVNLDNTDLSHLKLTSMYLVSASAVKLDLSASTLIFANFSDSLLRDANLKGTTFIDSILTKTDLSGAHIDDTDFHWCSAEDLITNDTDLSSITVMIESDLFLKGVHTTQKSRTQALPITLHSVPSNYCVIS